MGYLKWFFVVGFVGFVFFVILVLFYIVNEGIKCYLMFLFNLFNYNLLNYIDFVKNKFLRMLLCKF